MPEYNSVVTPEIPWENGKAIVKTNTPDTPTITMEEVKLEVRPEKKDFQVSRTDYPKGLIVVIENEKPAAGDNTAEFPVIITNEQNIMLPLNGWPRGGGVIFL